MLTGLGWHKNSAGTEMDSSSQALVLGNKSPATVTGSGFKGSLLANVGMNIDLVGTAQANGIGVAAMQMKNSQLQVLGNQVTGFVNAFGGAASANMVLVASGEGRKPLSSTQLLVQGNRASNVDALGAKANVLLGTGSLQMPGRSSVNTVLTDATELSNVRASLTDNEASNVTSIGGSALANALTAARSTIKDSQVLSTSNHAKEIRAGGGSAGIGRGTIAQVNLTGVAAANTAAIASSELRNAQLTLADNRAENMTTTGGSALANSVSFTDHRLGGSGYQASLTSNEARNVNAWGGEGSILGGALAEVRVSAAALANAISVQKGELTNRPVHGVDNNRASDVVATGGGAAANSIWLDNATVKGGQIQITDNTAHQIRTTGMSGSVGAGIVASADRNGRALGNTAAMDRQSTVDQSRVTVTGNTSTNVTGLGGMAAANSLAVTEGRVNKTTVTLANNEARNVQSKGGSASVGAGLLYSTSQDSVALANSLSVGGSQLDAKNLYIVGNNASNLNARGGTLMANSVALESGGATAAQLSANGAIVNNTANNMSTTAKSTSGAGGLVSNSSNARAAANSLVLHEDVHMDTASPWAISTNTANGVHAGGGTALVNALAAYRGARIQSSPVTILGNTGENISTGGGASQALGMGSKTNGILAANSVYMEGPDSVSLRSTPVQITANTARQLSAKGGRMNANAVAVNGSGKVQSSTLNVIGNTATNLRSEGEEKTLIGHAIDKGVGQANANAIQVLASLRGATFQLVGNTADNLSATKGLAAANSIVQDDGADMNALNAMVIGNHSSQTSASNGKTALANSIAAEGSSSIKGSSIQVFANRGGARAESGDAVANSVRSRKGGSVSASSVTVAGNNGSSEKGAVNSVDTEGSVRASSITILGNQGSASRGGTINSVTGRGSITGGQIAILGNRGSASDGTANSVTVDGSVGASSITILGNHGTTNGGGTVNSVTGSGSIKASQILIAANSGSARGGGTVNSVSNKGSIAAANITLIGNQGSATGGGTVNSVENKGQLSGMVVIAGNRGSATMGGKVNSLINDGVMTGAVVIAGNQGRSVAGGVSNSVINKGVITGAVTIVGNNTASAAGITSGSVRNIGGAVTGVVGVAGNAAFAANPGYTYVTPSVGVVNNSVTVVPAFNIVSN
ncbi:hypothetical protein H9K75_05530 [Diaphorobacter aerolatus]|uniref:Uncharacterized protein n=2 Tax=Diaphorobacter aerolatus TaxID=1288495 RepID=A0A7H0GQ53_9BURK|nr:hypothetical protein H9K75_05530 [Diaphorobacter aerolatus]